MKRSGSRIYADEPLKRRKRSVSRAKSLTTKVNRILRGVEVKNFDVTQTVPTAANTWIIKTVNAVDQGDSGSQRDGRRVEMKSLRLNMLLNDQANVRVVLFYQPLNAYGSVNPLVGDLFDTNSMMSQYQYTNNYAKAFIPVYDRILTPQCFGYSSTNGPLGDLSRSILIPLDKHATFQDAAGTSIVQGRLILCWWTQFLTGVSDQINTRILFTDA